MELHQDVGAVLLRYTASVADVRDIDVFAGTRGSGLEQRQRPRKPPRSVPIVQEVHKSGRDLGFMKPGPFMRSDVEAVGGDAGSKKPRNGTLAMPPCRARDTLEPAAHERRRIAGDDQKSIEIAGVERRRHDRGGGPPVHLAAHRYPSVRGRMPSAVSLS